MEEQITMECSFFALPMSSRLCVVMVSGPNLFEIWWSLDWKGRVVGM